VGAGGRGRECRGSALVGYLRTVPTDLVTPGLQQVVERFRSLSDGALAQYIPELALADPDLFGIAACGMHGRQFAAGDDEVEFSIQSVSKPFVYALALEDRGLDDVLDRIGAEPSGEAFNAISLEPGTGRPENPMINAGAIATTALVRGRDADERFARILDLMSRCAGRRLVVDERVHASESATGDRNRALAYLMAASGSLEGPVEESVDVYFRQCSVLVTVRDLAMMAATLATGGRNPVTGEQVMTADVARHVLSVMSTCGMYDYSGRWMLQVGLPAKSGVSGAPIAVSPGKFGVGVFSPPLDRRGNSVRGVAALEALSHHLGLHLLHDPLRRFPALE
jgi:glutaminase